MFKLLLSVTLLLTAIFLSGSAPVPDPMFPQGNFDNMPFVGPFLPPIRPITGPDSSIRIINITPKEKKRMK